jgi:hypothetical protein
MLDILLTQRIGVATEIAGVSGPAQALAVGFEGANIRIASSRLIWIRTAQPRAC